MAGTLQGTLWDHFGMSASFLKSAYRVPAVSADLNIKYSHPSFWDSEFTSIVNGNRSMDSHREPSLVASTLSLTPRCLHSCQGIF